MTFLGRRSTLEDISYRMVLWFLLVILTLATSLHLSRGQGNEDYVIMGTLVRLCAAHDLVD